MKQILDKLKKGDISTAFVTIIAVFIISMVFFQNIMLNLEVEKYTVMNQYARNALLICESEPVIEIKDLNAVYDALADKILTGNKDTMSMYVWLGDTDYAGASSKYMIMGGTNGNGQTLKPLFAQKINIRIEYNYSSFRLVPSASNSKTLQMKRGDLDNQQMSVELATTSKRRASV